MAMQKMARTSDVIMQYHNYNQERNKTETRPPVLH